MKEEQRFILVAPDVGAISATEEVGINLEALKSEFGYNFNTLIINNGSTVELIVKLNGRQVAYLGADDVLALDWEDGIFFDDIRIKNNDAATNTGANEIRVTVGRTGVKRNGL